MTTLRDSVRASYAQIPQGFPTPNLGDNVNLDFHPGFISHIMSNQFGGEPMEDPAEHIEQFTDYCNLCRREGVTQDQMKEMLFHFSLRGKAKKWLSGLNRAALCITGWPDLVIAFYNHHYPPERTAYLRSQLMSFSQHAEETLYMAWERFKDLKRGCPHHGLPDSVLVMQFYHAIRPESRQFLDMAANGQFLTIAVDRAWDTIEEMAIHSNTYGMHGVYSLKDAKESMLPQFNNLHQGMDNLSMNATPQFQPSPPQFSYHHQPSHTHLPPSPPKASSPIHHYPISPPPQDQDPTSSASSELEEMRQMMLQMHKQAEQIKRLEAQVAQFTNSNASRPHDVLPSQPTPEPTTYHMVNEISLFSETSHESPELIQEEMVEIDMDNIENWEKEYHNFEIFEDQIEAKGGNVISLEDVGILKEGDSEVSQIDMGIFDMPKASINNPHAERGKGQAEKVQSKVMMTCPQQVIELFDAHQKNPYVIKCFDPGIPIWVGT